MAEGGVSPATTGGPVGYPREIFENIDSKYLCAHCGYILRNPLQNYCGHRFCQDCFDYLIKNCKGAELVCALCKADGSVNDYSSLTNEQTFPDNALKREFSKLIARCVYPGCSWSGPFKDFETHFDECEFKPKPSSENLQLQLGDKSIAVVYHDLYKRVESCDHVLGPLDERVNKLGVDIRRLESTAVARRQDTSVVPASSSSGAAATTAAAAARHTSLPASSAAATSSSQLKEMDDKLELMERIITIFTRELEKYSEQTFAMERQDRLFRDSLNTALTGASHLDQMMAAKDKAIGEVEKRVTAMDETSYNGTLVWKITNFKQRQQDAINGHAMSIYSPPFWTSRTGYKMCARVYLNGDGMGKGTHVSMFFVVMRGNFDALLKWPFKQKVTLMVLDQDNRNHVTDSFRPDPTSSSFKRPTAEMNVASGCPLFMPLSLLDNSLNAYVRDDTFFVKVIVSLDGLN